MFPFLRLAKTDHKFKTGVSFDNVLDLYRFDKKLRVLIDSSDSRTSPCSFLLSYQLSQKFYENQYLLKASFSSSSYLRRIATPAC